MLPEIEVRGANLVLDGPVVDRLIRSLDIVGPGIDRPGAAEVGGRAGPRFVGRPWASRSPFQVRVQVASADGL